MQFPRKFLLIGSLCVATFLPDVASAYILPATALLRQYIVNRKKYDLKDMTLELDLSFNEDSPESQSYEGRLYFVDGGGMRLVASGDAGESFILTEQNKVRQSNAADSLYKQFPKNDMLASLFFPGGEKQEQSMNRVTSSLKHYGVNMEKQSYYRYEGEVVQMVGGKPADKDNNQIWLFKSSGIPAFYRMTSEGFDGQQHKYEIYLRGWGSPQAGNWFPAEVEYRCDGKHLLTITVQKAKKNTNLPSSLFSTLQG